MNDILVAPVQVHDWSGATTFAARLAAQMSASLTGLCALEPIPKLPHAASPLQLGDSVAYVQEHRRSVLGAQEAFRSWARSQGVSQAHWQVAEMSFMSALQLAGVWNDLVVIERDRVPDYYATTSPGEVLLSVQRPCLVVPSALETPSLECAVLAWNGTSESLRAIRAARPLLARARQVFVVGAEHCSSAGRAAWNPPLDLLAWLQSHGMPVERRVLTVDDARAGEGLLAIAAEVGAGLLVMGAWGHTRLGEWAFGGATRHVLQHATVPVLMRH
jgi:nucleotide-binding universal stress UspA family protein